MCDFMIITSWLTVTNQGHSSGFIIIKIVFGVVYIIMMNNDELVETYNFIILRTFDNFD